MNIRNASTEDWPAVEALLRSCGLPLEGAREHLGDFIVCERDGVVGCAGAEIYGDAALLRSIAVRDDARGGGVGGTLLDTMLARLRARHVKTVGLLTTAAESYFAARHFATVARDRLPAALGASKELQGACPASAVAMVRQL